MVSQLRAAILSLNPTMYWPLDELVGLTAFDLSGNGNNGTYNSNIQQGVTGVPGDVPGSTGIEFFPQPGAAPFKGVSRSGLAAPPGLSVVFYFRIFVNTFGASEVPFSWTGGSANGFLCQFNSASQNLQLLVGTAGGYVALADVEQFMNFSGHWNMACFTYDSVLHNTLFYVNGALRASLSATTVGLPPTRDFTVGFFNVVAQSQPYTGDIAHVALFPSVLSFTAQESIFSAGGSTPAAVGNVQAASQAGAIPTGYVLGTANAGLTGSGNIAVPQLFGALVQLTTVPSTWGRTYQSPTGYVPSPGSIWFSDLNGDEGPHYVHNPAQLIFSENRTNLLLRYSFRPGIVATITPITLT